MTSYLMQNSCTYSLAEMESRRSVLLILLISYLIFVKCKVMWIITRAVSNNAEPEAESQTWDREQWVAAPKLWIPRRKIIQRTISVLEGGACVLHPGSWWSRAAAGVHGVGTKSLFWVCEGLWSCLTPWLMGGVCVLRWAVLPGPHWWKLL